MKKSVIIISLFLLGTAFYVKAQEMTQKEKTSYTIGVMLGEKIKESGMDISIIESIKGKIDFEFIKEGIHDHLKGESKLSKEEIETALAELQKKIDYYKEMMEAKQSQGSESEIVKSNKEKEEANRYKMFVAFLDTISQDGQKEKIHYAIGVMLGEKIKESGMDISIIESIKERVDFETLREGIRDTLKGECKLTKEEIETNLAEIQKKIEYYRKIIEAKQSQ